MVDARTIATYDKKAGDYADLVATDQPDASLAAFIALIPAGGTVLDLGCGPGTASAHMRAAGLKPHPMDASPGMIKIAKETFNLDAKLATFEDIDGTMIYDGVWANFSLLHAPRADLPRYLTMLFDALKPGGVFHIGMKTGTGAKRDGIDRLYTFVTVRELTTLLITAGFEITHTQEGREAGMAGTIDPFVIMRGKKT